MALNHKKYLDVIKHTTLTSIDLVIYFKDKILLGFRNNEPAKIAGLFLVVEHIKRNTT